MIASQTITLGQLLADLKGIRPITLGTPSIKQTETTDGFLITEKEYCLKGQITFSYVLKARKFSIPHLDKPVELVIEFMPQYEHDPAGQDYELGGMLFRV